MGFPVTLTGTGYSNHVHVVLTMSDGTVVDDAYYQSPGGVLTLHYYLSPADTYRLTTSVHGDHETIDDMTVTSTPTL